MSCASHRPFNTPYPENNTVRAHWFPAKPTVIEPKPGKKAVIVLPHWNAHAAQHVALCRGISVLGISALRLSLPYHDLRMPPETKRADYAVSSNVGRTIDATRQAVIDIRSCLDWLQQQGYERLGIVGTSLGSAYAFLTSAHDDRLAVNIFNHCSTQFADVVWTGLSTQHIRQSMEPVISLERARAVWAVHHARQLHSPVRAKAKEIAADLRQIRHHVSARILEGSGGGIRRVRPGP